MRKLKIQVQASLDGYMAGIDGDMSWMIWDWDSGLKDYVSRLTEPVGTILLGRKLAEGFIDHWKKVADDASNPEREDGKVFTAMEKFVFSRTLTSSRWDRATVVGGDLQTFVSGLKGGDGSDIIAYGGSAFLGSLIGTGLVDEYNVFINPTALGSGMRIFPERLPLELVESKSFDCGIVSLRLRPKA